MKVRVQSWIGALALLWPATAASQEANRAPPDSPWSRVTVEAPLVTRHTTGNDEFNNRNYGLIVDVALNDRWSVVGGGFRNSYDRNTAIAGVAWQPLSVQLGQRRVRFGAMAAVDLSGGYRAYNTADPLLGAFSVRLTDAASDAPGVLDRFGLLLTIIPPAPRYGSTALNLALTYRLR